MKKIISKVAENKLKLLTLIEWDWSSYKDKSFKMLNGICSGEQVTLSKDDVFGHKPIYKISINDELVAQGSNYDDLCQVAKFALEGYEKMKSEKLKTLSKDELKIYKAVKESFPSTNWLVAFNTAIAGGADFQFINK